MPCGKVDLLQLHSHFRCFVVIESSSVHPRKSRHFRENWLFVGVFVKRFFSSVKVCLRSVLRRIKWVSILLVVGPHQKRAVVVSGTFKTELLARHSEVVVEIPCDPNSNQRERKQCNRFV